MVPRRRGVLGWLSLRSLLWTAIYALGIYLIATHTDELADGLSVLADGKVQYVLLGFVAEILFFITQAYLGRLLYKAVDVSESALRIGLISLASTFINDLVRSGGFAGGSIFLEDAARRRLPVPRVALAFLLRLLLLNIVNLFIVITALAYISLNRDLNVYEVSAATFFLVVVILSGVLLLVAAKNPAWLVTLLTRLLAALNRVWSLVTRKALLDAQKTSAAMAQFSEAARLAQQRWRHLLVPFALACVVKVVDMADLYFMFLAFHGSVPFAGVVMGYGISFLGGMVAPTPGGLVIVEASMAAAFTTVLDVPLGTAVVVVLAFRLVDFWLPLFLGAISLRILHRTA